MSRVPTGHRPTADPEPTITTIVPILGMTCRTCEARIERHVARLPGVIGSKASAARGRVEIESRGPLRIKALDRAIEAAGYEIGENPWLTRDGTVWVTAGLGLALVIGLATIARITGIGDLAAGVGDLATGGIAIALLLGLAAGVSTCMAMVGGLVLALSAAFQAARVRDELALTVVGQLRPALVFTAGRIVGYGLFGAALGALGAGLEMPPLVTAALMVGVGVVMALLGTRLTGLSPRLAGWSPTLPMGLGRRLGFADGTVATYSDRRAAIFGAASFFLPCGFTQAVQIFALSTGSPPLGGALLATFALGTAPGLLALAGLPILVPGSARPTLLRLVGVVVLAFAVVNVSSGVRLAGFALPAIGGVAGVTPEVTFTEDGTQLLTTYQNADGYSPANVAIYAGYPTRWTIESRTTASCAAFIVFPKFGVQARLDLGPNVFDLAAMPAGRFDYMCTMGMYGGSITIVDPPSGFTPGDTPG
ncbi:MAG: hypothetical protein FIA92_10330 [Chloroflexi bacterium]|nr:hypothetical protein [Chloroflexota bacterium]